MKMIMIAAVALLLLGGGGAGAYFYFKHPAEAATGAVGEHGKEAKAAKKGHGEEGHAASFVQLDPLILPIIGKDGLTETVSMVIVIETPSEESKAEVAYMAPKLKDAFIQDMYGALTQDSIMKSGVIQVGPLKARLHKIGARVLGEEAVSDVLLQVVQQRRI